MENNQTKSKNSNGRGGARKGSGRKAGTANKRTREVADKAAATGLTPLEVMLDNMTFAHTQAADLLGKLLESGAEVPEGFDQYKELLKFRGMAQDAAKDAAPYMHPRLTAVEHTGANGAPIETVARIELVPMTNGSNGAN